MLPVFLLLGSLLLGNERPISTPAYGIPNTNQQNAAVASDGNEFVVVWPDPDAKRVFSAHVSATGQVLTQPSTIIDNDRAAGMRLFWTGDHYVAFWSSQADNRYDLRLERLDRNGVPLEPARMIMKNGFGVVAWNGRNFLAALPSGNTVGLLLLSPDGDVVKQSLYTVPNDWATSLVIAVGDVFWIFHSKITVVATTDRFGNITYSSYYTLYANRVSAAGDLLDAQPLVVFDRIDSLSINMASNGRTIAGVVYEQNTGHPFLIDATTGIATVASVEVPLRDPVMTTDGSSYLLTWISGNNALQAIPLDALGTAPSQQCCTGIVIRPSMAWNGRSYLAVWSDSRDQLPATGGYVHIYGTLLDANGRAADDGHPLAIAARNQTAVSTAGSLVVWAERDANARSVEVHASLNGGAPIVLSQPAPDIDATAAVFTGSSYIAGWTERTNLTTHVFMRRIGADAPLPLGIGTDITFTFDGTNVLAVWLGTTGLVGQRFKPDGNIVDAVPFQISTTGGYQPRVTWNGSEYLVAWWEGTSHCFGGICPKNFRDVKASRISAEGAVLDVIPIAVGGLDQFTPVVASDGRDFLVAYQTRSLTGEPGPSVFVRRVLADGSVLDAGAGFPIGDGIPVQAIWLKDRYVIAIEEPTAEYELHAIEVDPAAATTIGDTLLAKNAAAAQPFGGAWVAYARGTDEPLYGGAVRAFTRPLFDETRRRSF